MKDDRPDPTSNEEDLLATIRTLVLEETQSELAPAPKAETMFTSAEEEGQPKAKPEPVRMVLTGAPQGAAPAPTPPAAPGLSQDEVEDIATAAVKLEMETFLRDELEPFVRKMVRRELAILLKIRTEEDFAEA